MFLEFINTFLQSAIEIVSFYILTCGFLDYSLFPKIQTILYGILTLILCISINYSITSYPISFLLSSLLIIAYFCITTKVSFLHMSFLYLIEYSLLIILELLLLPLFGLNAASVHHSLFQYIGLFFVLLITLIAYHILPLSTFYELLSQRNNTFLVIILNSFLLIWGCASFVLFKTENFFQNYLMVFLVIIVLVFLNGEVFTNHKKSLERQKQLEAYQTYLPIIENLIEQVRFRQHDYHNNIQSIRSLGYSCTDYESLKNSLLDTTEHYLLPDIQSLLLKLNMHLVAGFLVSKSLEAQHNHKSLHIEIGSYYLQTQCTEYEIIEYIGILIDNALDATPIHGNIYAKISSKHNKLIFQIQNPGTTLTPEFCKNIFSRNYTTKCTNPTCHGIGLYKLNKYVQELRGELYLENTEINQQTYIKFQLII
ncbi:MAG: GHKL domain-containing protein [Lachnospiraceae bacterium]|nr:GHKL domain-containing protein [Lachnospiraceae bacterium]